MAGVFGRLKKKAARFRNKVDQHQEAVTFAEAGQQEHARALFRADDVEDKPGKLLVVGRESMFSREVMDYALEMAQRLSYEILALNTAPLSCETFKLFSASQDKLCEGFRELSEQNVKAFRDEAEKMGIPFAHEIRFCDKNRAVEEINKEYRDIEFVLSDTEEEQAVERVAEGERVKKAIYVYAMV
ncbi:hypothetical protein ACFL0Q_06205 [Thermodesulfobacteriota bacterium]